MCCFTLSDLWRCHATRHDHKEESQFFFLRKRLEVFSLDRMELANAYSLATIIITYDYTVNLLRFF
nr:MAG TPA: hypothetical protein [Caudoviricetes sp.]